MQLSKGQVQSLQDEVLEWFNTNKRDLPWRHTRDPYCILVSEVMSQQTQIIRVVTKYIQWIDVFPTLSDVANAKVPDLLRLWSGLGYNRRVLQLKQTADIVVSQYSGNFPTDEKTLRSLPGIGSYTARALLCFAFDKQVAVVDTNVRRFILTRVIKPETKSQISRNLKYTDPILLTIAQSIMPIGRAYEWNQALMDYSAIVLKKETIPIPKQSIFKGSNRYYRGQVLKVLLRERHISIMQLGIYIKSDFKSTDIEWLNSLINKLCQEGFINIVGEDITLK